MGKVPIKNGTPVGNTHLCRSCSWGQCITGYRESDLLTICTNTGPNIVVPFTVHKCTEFLDKFKPDWSQMEKLAINIQPANSSNRTRGFAGAAGVTSRADEDPTIDEDEPALTC